MVGVTDPDVINLERTTERALEAGLKKVQVGLRLSDVSHAIQVVAEDAGFTVVRDFVGHGIGRDLHEDPQIPNFGRAGRGPKLREGMTLAIEPMVNMGKAAVKVLDDKWTVVTKDRKLSAHFEHTVLVQKSGMEILTK
jgi:methionyl aminopeptidase